MMRILGTLTIALAAASTARAQAPAQGPADTPRRFYAAPGYYGMAWGVPSYGYVRTYSSFSSPYGGGYGGGYAPSAILPGPYGAAMWRPGIAGPGFGYGASYYTFSHPADPNAPVAPVGAYAPSLGPGPYFPR